MKIVVRIRSLAVVGAVAAFVASSLATPAQALDSRCTLDGYVPWTDGVYVKTQTVLTCTATVGEKVGAQNQRLGVVWGNLGSMVYSPASAGSTYIASPVASYNCNGTGTKTYRGKRWARSTDNSERTTYSGGAALTC